MTFTDREDSRPILDDVLVAGGTGLVGAGVVRALRARAASFTATRHSSVLPEFAALPVYDFRDFDACLEATRGRSAVVICAALSHGAAQNRANPTGTILPNTSIAAGLLEACARNKVATVALISSSTVYQPAGHAIAEGELDLNQPPHPSYLGVGTLNRFIEQMAQAYAAQHGIRTLVLRPTSVYGPYDDFSEEKSHVVPALIRRALAGEDPFEVWGGPEVVRDFVYVDDVAEAVARALETDMALPGPMNVCSAEPVTIGTLVPLVLEACGHKARVRYDTSKPTGIPYRAVSGALLHRCFPGLEPTPLAEGLRRTVAWYRTRQA